MRTLIKEDGLATTYPCLVRNKTTNNIYLVVCRTPDNVSYVKLTHNKTSICDIGAIGHEEIYGFPSKDYEIFNGELTLSNK